MRRELRTPPTAAGSCAPTSTPPTPRTRSPGMFVGASSWAGTCAL